AVMDAVSAVGGAILDIAKAALSMFPPINGGLAKWIADNGDLLKTILGTTAAVFAGIVAIKALTITVGVLGAAFALLTSPIGLVVVAIGGLAYYFRESIGKMIGNTMDMIRHWDIGWPLMVAKSKLAI